MLLLVDCGFFFLAVEKMSWYCLAQFGWNPLKGSFSRQPHSFLSCCQYREQVLTFLKPLELLLQQISLPFSSIFEPS